jgi:hypothetical protein
MCNKAKPLRRTTNTEFSASFFIAKSKYDPGMIQITNRLFFEQSLGFSRIDGKVMNFDLNFSIFNVLILSQLYKTSTQTINFYQSIYTSIRFSNLHIAFAFFLAQKNVNSKLRL